MQEQQECSSDLSRSQSTDKPRHQENKKMDGKLQETMHMPYNLILQNGNNKWKDAIDLEIEQIKEYQVFKDYGKAVYEKDKIGNAPKGYQKLTLHFVFEVKHCGKFKARLLADGHLTREPNETVYSGVVSLRNLRLAMFLAELNNLQLWGAHVGNAHLQALQKKNSILWVVLNLKNYKDMLLLCTRHSMVQDLEEHVGITNILISSIKQVSNVQRQTQTYG